jgi:biotin synthase-like enzyme
VEFKELAKEIKEVFDKKGYTWKVAEVSTVPTEHDILETMQQMAKRLDQEPDGSWLELGRLIFIKTGSLIDVYVLHGTVRNNEQPTQEPVL